MYAWKGQTICAFAPLLQFFVGTAEFRWKTHSIDVVVNASMSSLKAYWNNRSSEAESGQGKAEPQYFAVAHLKLYDDQTDEVSAL